MNYVIGKEIGSGGTSSVHEYYDNAVIKVYKPYVTDDVINNELYIVELLNKYPLNIPKYIGKVQIDGKKALIYERINGNVLAEPLLKGHYDKSLASQYAKMHYELHKNEIKELSSQYEFLKNRIIQMEDIFGDRTIHLLNLLDDIPSGNQLCHGDYQPYNIIQDVNRYVTIDWNGACSGNPILDVAWSYLTLNTPIIKQLFGDLVSDTFTSFNNDYLYYYCKLAGIEENMVIKCIPIVAARRLYDNYLNDNNNSRQELEWLHRLIV